MLHTTVLCTFFGCRFFGIPSTNFVTIELKVKNKEKYRNVRKNNEETYKKVIKHDEDTEQSS